MATTTDPQIVEIWTVARQRYEAISQKKFKDFDLGAVKSVDDLERAVDAESRGFTAFREKRASIFKVMRNALIPVELAGKLLGGMEGGVFPASSVVFAAVKQLIAAAHDVSSKLDAIQDVMSQLQFFTIRLGVYNQEMISPELRTNLAEVLATLLQILALTTKAIERGRLRAFGRNMLRGEDTEIQDAAAKLDRLTSNVDSLVGAETSVLVQRQGRAVDALTTIASNTYDEFHQSLADNRDMHDEVIAAIKNSQRPGKDDERTLRQMVYALLQPSTKAQDIYAGISKGRLAGTGRWIQAESTFQAWLRNSDPVLWISGAPGAGKSYLSASIISYLQDKITSETHSSIKPIVGYFFFKDDKPETRSCGKALRDIAYQIAQGDVSYSKHLLSTCHSPEDIESIESAWQRLFVEYYNGTEEPETQVYIVLDGLDEAYDFDRSVFLPLLKDVTSTTFKNLHVRVVIAGRPHLSDTVADALENETIPTISIDESKNAGDIANYIRNGKSIGIRNSRKLRSVSKQLQEEIFETLTTKASGMFLWADLMLKELNSKRNESEIRDAMRKAPRGLTQMLHHVLEGLSEFSTEDDAEDLNGILALVTFAKRRLKLAEVDGFLRYSYGTGEGLLLLERKLRKDWGSFFVLSRDDGRTTAELEAVTTGVPDVLDDAINVSDDDDRSSREVDTDFNSPPLTTEVAFCHASIGDYFRNPDNGKVRAAQGPLVGVDSKDGSSYILKIILRVITDLNHLEILGEGSSFAGYAIAHWLDYLRDVEKSNVSVEDRVEIGTLLLKLCRDEDVLESYNFFHGRSFWASDAISVVRSWLEDPELLKGQSEADQEWIKATADLPVQTFKAMALLGAKRWLDSITWEATNLFWSTWAYLQLLDGKTSLEPSQGVSDAQVVINAAEWPEFERTANWHRRVAMTLRDTNLLDDAVIYFKRALELEPDMWIARAGLSSLFERQGRIQAALAMNLEVISHCRLHAKADSEACNLTDFSNSLGQAGEYYSMLGNEAEAYRVRREAWDTNPARSLDAFDKCIEYLHAQSRFEDAMDLFEELNTKQDPDDPPRNLMTPWILWKSASESVLFALVERAARKSQRVQVVIDAIRKACTPERTTQRSVAELGALVDLASLYYTHGVDEERAMRIWRHVASIGEASTMEMAIGSIAIVKERAIKNLCTYYYIRAEETEGTDEGSRYREILEDLGTARDRREDLVGPGWASLILGRWYYMHGSPKKAQVHFRANVKYGMQILTDDDPDNDVWGWMYVAQTLLFADDAENSIAILRALFSHRAHSTIPKVVSPAHEDKGRSEGLDSQAKAPDSDLDGSLTAARSSTQAGSAKQVDAEKSGPQPKEDEAEAASRPAPEEKTPRLSSMCCSGDCEYIAGNSPWLKPWWICLDCVDGVFCEECLARLRAGTLPVKICRASHKFLRYTNLPVLIPQGTIMIGDDRLEDIEDWKKRMKKEWKV